MIMAGGTKHQCQIWCSQHFRVRSHDALLAPPHRTRRPPISRENGSHYGMARERTVPISAWWTTQWGQASKSATRGCPSARSALCGCRRRRGATDSGPGLRPSADHGARPQRARTPSLCVFHGPRASGIIADRELVAVRLQRHDWHRRWNTTVLQTPASPHQEPTLLCGVPLHHLHYR
jgi:hypothetical protein